MYCLILMSMELLPPYQKDHQFQSFSQSKDRGIPVIMFDRSNEWSWNKQCGDRRSL